MIALGAAVALVAARLAAAGIEDSRREARIILAAACKVDAAGLLSIDVVDEAVFEPVLRRREAREPLAYILGRREFWGLMFEVSPATLIPRPDSETLVEAALAAGPYARVLDLGTGTGCLLLAVLHEFPSAFGIGVDISPAAAALAARNAAALKISDRAAFFAGSWADALDQQFDLVLSNPPYIPATEILTLMPEVQKFEPVGALDGGVDGLDAYRKIVGNLPRLLAPGGRAILELGVGQAKAVAELAAGADFDCATRADLSGIARAAVLTRRK